MEALSEQLERTADYIEQHGHTKGVLENSDGAVCAVGAVLKAVGCNVNVYQPVVRAVELYIAPPNVSFSAWRNVVVWNNAPERSPQEVIDAFRGAAKQQRIKEESGVY